MYRRLTRFIERERQTEHSLIQVLLSRIPRRVVSKVAPGVLEYGNVFVMNPLINAPRFRRFQSLHRVILNDHFYIIVMPNTLHFLVPCLGLIPSDVNVALLLNGAARWEEEYLRRRFEHRPIFRLRTMFRSSLAHGRVLNMLFDYHEVNFGIIDHDLYIFNKDTFGQLTFEDGQCAIGAFRIHNEKANIEFPTTHFMFFNMKLIRMVRSKYKIGAHMYRRIPRQATEGLRSLNLGYHNFPKDYLSVFDTMNLLLAMALFEGFSFRFIEGGPGDFFHIGGTSTIGGELHRQFIGLKFLEMAQDEEIRERYANLYPALSRSQDIGAHLPNTWQAHEYVAYIDRVVGLIENAIQTEAT